MVLEYEISARLATLLDVKEPCVLPEASGLWFGWWCLVSCLGFSRQGLEFGVWGLGSEVWGLRFGVWGSEFFVLCFGFRAYGLGFWVWGLGFRSRDPDEGLRGEGQGCWVQVQSVVRKTVSLCPRVARQVCTCHFGVWDRMGRWLGGDFRCNMELRCRVRDHPGGIAGILTPHPPHTREVVLMLQLPREKSRVVHSFPAMYGVTSDWQ